MSDIAIQVDHVWKKFRRGQMHDSLREWIPALAKELFSGKGDKNDLAEREFWVLKDICFQVPKGQSLGIIGPNGAGKSTMLKMLSKIIKPNRGSYQVNGRLSSLIEVGAGFHGDLTGRENIYLNGIILGMTRKEIQAKEEAIIDFSGVEAFIETPVKRYSSGMLARLGFSVAAHMDPQVLLVDEVLSVGDARFRDKCVRRMDSLLRSGITVVFISHIMEQVKSLCQKTIVLDKGEIIYQGATDGAIRKYLDVLAAAGTKEESNAKAPAEIRNLRLTDPQGSEVLDFVYGQPARLQFDLCLHQPVEKASVQVNFHTLSGLYLTTLNSIDQAIDLPNQPGTYPLSLSIDRLPLTDGNYKVDLKIYADADQQQCLWVSPQARCFSVTGYGRDWVLVDIPGHWAMLPIESSVR